MTRQQKRAAARSAAKATLAEVEHGDTVLDMWRVYYRARFERFTSRPLEPEHIAMLREVFYSGAAAMLQLTLKASEPENEDVCVGNMERLEDELKTFARGLQ